MIINNSSPEHHLLRKIYRHVDFSFIHELVVRRMEPFPSPEVYEKARQTADIVFPADNQ